MHLEIIHSLNVEVNMKNLGNHFLLLIISSFFMFLTILATSILSDLVLNDPAYIAQVDQNLFYLIGIKLTFLMLFSFTRKLNFNIIRTILGILAGNMVAIAFISITTRIPIESYLPYGLNMLLDIIFIFFITIFFNIRSYKKHHEEEIDEINQYMDMKKDADALQNNIQNLHEELDFIKTLIKEKEDILANKTEEIEKLKNLPSFESGKTQSVTVPLQIDISEQGKIRSLYIGEVKEEESSQIFSEEEEIKTTPLNINLHQVLKDLEQRSQNILEQNKILDEREQYINEQLQILEEKQKDYEEQPPQILFDQAIEDNEIIVKDKNSEIIIKKEDLDQIHKIIEKAL